MFTPRAASFERLSSYLATGRETKSLGPSHMSHIAQWNGIDFNPKKHGVHSGWVPSKCAAGAMGGVTALAAVVSAPRPGPWQALHDQHGTPHVFQLYFCCGLRSLFSSVAGSQEMVGDGGGDAGRGLGPTHQQRSQAGGEAMGDGGGAQHLGGGAICKEEESSCSKSSSSSSSSPCSSQYLPGEAVQGQARG